METLLLQVVSLFLAAADAGPGQAETLFEMPAEAGSLVEISASVPGAGHWAAIVSRGAGKCVITDGKESGCHDDIGQVTLHDEQGLFYWYRDGDAQSVMTPAGPAGSFTAVRLPDLAWLSGMRHLHPADWTYRAGTRTVFAARTQAGEWEALLRYPSEPTVQERRAMPTALTVAATGDPGGIRTTESRYVLVRDRLPLFLAMQEEEECLVLGSKPVACGRQVSLLAFARETDRAAFGVQRDEGFFFHSGVAEHGPTANVDWVTFSPDGTHLAFVMRDAGGEHALYVDDVRLEAAPRIESVAFLGDGQVAWVAHREKSSQLLRNDKVVAERDLISAVYVSPRGDLSYGGEHQGKRFLEPAPAGLSFTSLFGEGFLASGELYAIAARAGGGKVLVKGTATAGPFDAITGTVLSPDRTEVAAVGRSAAGRDTLLVGTTAVREFEGVVAASVWCKGMKGPVIHVQSGVEECLRGADGADVCCPRVVLWGCSEGQGVTAVCSTGKGFEVRTAGKSGSPAAYEDVPLGLFYSDPLEGHVAFAGRRGEQWVVMVDGKEWPVEARPVLVLPEEDGPWYQVVSGAGQKFVRTGGPTRAYQQVNAPVFHKGHSLFRAREGGKDVWVVDGVETLRCERLDPAPVPAGDGVLVWGSCGGGVGVYRIRLQAPGVLDQGGGR